MKKLQRAQPDILVISSSLQIFPVFIAGIETGARGKQRQGCQEGRQVRLVIGRATPGPQ